MFNWLFSVDSSLFNWENRLFAGVGVSEKLRQILLVLRLKYYLICKPQTIENNLLTTYIQYSEC